MNKKKKDFMNRLSNLDDFYVEEIAEKYPALNRSTKRRILKQCMKKDFFFAETGYEDKEAITVSETGRYKGKHLYRFAASAAAFVIAIVGITSVFMLNRNFSGSDIPEVERPSATNFSDKNDYVTSEKSESSTNNTPVSLNETSWHEYESDFAAEHFIVFGNDGFSGHYITPPYDYTTEDPLQIYFTYTQNGNELLIHMGSDTATGKLSSSNNDQRGQVMMTLVWADGRTEYFYNTSIASSDNSNENNTPAETEPPVNNNNTPQTTTEVTEPPVNNNTPQTSTEATEPTVNNSNTPQTTTEIKKPNVNNTISFDHVSLNETNWYEHKIDGSTENAIEFSNDGFSGHYITPPEDYTIQDATKIYLTYTQNGDEILFRMGSDTATGKLSFSDDRKQVMMTLAWADGSTEYFYTSSITINSDGSLEYCLPPDDGYTAQPTTTDSNLVSLNGTNWYEYELDGPLENSIVFGKDGFSGHYVIPPEDYTTKDPTLIYFTYTQNENEIFIRMGSDTATGKLSSANNDPRGQVMMTLVWANGDTEYLYNSDIPVTDLQN